MQKKNTVIALFLSLISGLGHFYIGRKISGFFYLLGFSAPIFFGVFLGFWYRDTGPMVLAGISLIIWIICIIDISISILRHGEKTYEQQLTAGYPIQGDSANETVSSTKATTLFFAIIPGAGHFYLGFMQRGLILMITFFGSFILISFMAAITNLGLFLVLYLALPIIWFYSFFDVAQMLRRKENGEEIQDSIVFDELVNMVAVSKNIKLLCLVLSIIPGAGHMLLGKTIKGIQIMSAFFISVFFINELQLNMLLFLIPVIWFYSIFTVMKPESGDPSEEARWLKNIPNWLGISLLLIGIYYLLIKVAIPVVDPYVPVRLMYFVHTYLNNIIGAILLMVVGVVLLRLNKNTKQLRERES